MLGEPTRKPMMHPIPVEEREKDEWEFFPQAFEAWRAWRIVELDGILLLQSVTHRTNWLPRQEFIAECLPIKKDGVVIRKHVHAAPDLEHGCGIYSLKSAEGAMMWANEYLRTDTRVYGKVSIWGTCFKFQKGYLSELAYPSNLYVPPNVTASGDKRSIDIHPEELAVELASTYRIEAMPFEYTPDSARDNESLEGGSQSDG